MPVIGKLLLSIIFIALGLEHLFFYKSQLIDSKKLRIVVGLLSLVVGITGILNAVGIL